ncbi:MAG: quinone oxidoreductase [Candidatus Thiodiazotropha weberae]|nr:quinone oxidoreductase [Candidatus Thiodiazotropha lotti]MCG8013041.1 quinone oxidoreductase [Candidatus Thiodiazotropha lotti]MCG8021714.1 quinone oxidoreductase [Candidatus Thiodiazotropha lotti]MCW4208885.1 quinone oxidoreductase [Candidatus Thiodiazotropha lotti]MCW4212513.1 quinone oxidoreductase [Candidatus Thiodiazotropha lotti]
MSKAILISEHGGSDKLHYADVPLQKPTDGEVRIAHQAIGLNFIDVYHRTGLYPPPSLPFIPGMEAAGIIEEVGPKAIGFAVGDRVAYGAGPLGAYAQARNIPAERLVKIPDEISDREAAAMMLKGMTAEYLICRTYQVKAGETILVHAASGGVGQILCQWASAIGATVIGTVGNAEKAAKAEKLGCRFTINYRAENIEQRVMEITEGRGLPVVYDSVGLDTFEASLNCLAPRGLLVSFGQSSGKVPAFDITRLSQQGSLYITRPTLMDYVKSTDQLQRRAQSLFDSYKSGKVKINIGQTYPLSKARQAHDDLENRMTTGSTVLIPD